MSVLKANSMGKKLVSIVHSEASCGWGGQEHRVFSELLLFHKLGHRVALVAPKKSALHERCTQVGLKVFNVEFERKSFLGDALRLISFLRDFAPDVVNTHSSRDGWCMGIASRLASVPLLIRSRHIDANFGTPLVSRVAFNVLADHVITTSDAIAAKVGSVLSVPQIRLSTVATGVDLTKFKTNGETANLSRSHDGPLIGMVSVLRSWKGHDLFFEAIRLLRDRGFVANFVVVGGGAEITAYEKLARNQGVRDLVHFTGHREDVPEILRALDLLIIPSTRHEGIPQIGLQALASGTPVVGSSVGGIPEIIKQGETGRIFEAGCSHSLAGAIQAVFQEPAQTAEMCLKGVELVRDFYGVESMHQRLNQIYESYLQ